MTPLEINKKIAEAKFGDDFIYYESGYVEAFTLCRPYNWLCRPYNWAENIADAWELFEEMPGAELKHDDSTEDGKDFYYCIEKKTNQHIYGDTAPLAICNAWLAWMESKK